MCVCARGVCVLCVSTYVCEREGVCGERESV